MASGVEGMLWVTVSEMMVALRRQVVLQQSFMSRSWIRCAVVRWKFAQHVRACYLT